MRTKFYSAAMCLCFCIAAPLLLSAQKSITDSLVQVIRTSKTDTCVIDAKNELASYYRKRSKHDTAEIVAREALNASLQSGYLRGEGNARYQLGTINALRGDAVGAMKGLDSAAIIFEQIGDNKMLASALQAYGLQKSAVGDFPSALQYCLRALAIKRQLGDSSVLSTTYNNIGHIYKQTQDHAKALEAYRNGVRIDSVAGNLRNLATGYYNIGNTIMTLHGDTSLALQYLDKAIAIADSIEDPLNAAYPMALTAQVLLARNQFDASKEIHLQVIAIADDAGDVRLKLSSLLALGRIEDYAGNRVKALEYLTTAENLANQFQIVEYQVIMLRELSEFYARGNDHKKALEYMKLYVRANDSLINNEKYKEMTRLELNYAFEKQRELDKAEQAKNEALFEEDKKNKMYIIYFGALFLLLVLVFLVFVYNRYRISQRQKALIAEQKTEVERQKDLVQEKNKDITDSINYAQRIQSAILPDRNEFIAALPDSFVLYKPKDIVSGDFYWVTQSAEYTYYATADCTGHGVPGGFMSVLGASLLNEIVNERKVTGPAEILNIMRDRIIQALKQKGMSGENKDGMDMVLCRLNRQTRELVYAAANNPIWIMGPDGIREFDADKQPVGIGVENPQSFREHSIALQAGEVIYTFTDGFADQFGGPKGKKFKYAQLRETLKRLNTLPMEQQSVSLEKVLLDWKGSLDQVDDILLIGVRV